MQNRKMPLKIKLNCLRTNKSSLLYLGTSKTLSLGEFDESQTHIILIYFSGLFLVLSNLFSCQILEYLQTLCFAEINSKRKEFKQERREMSNYNSLCHDTILYVATQRPNYWHKSYVAAEDNMSRHREQEESRNFVATKPFMSRHSLLQQTTVG